MPGFKNARLVGRAGLWDVAVESGVITAVTRNGALLDGEDLEGRVLAPGFIDAHCHILPMGLDLQKLDLSTAQTPSAILDAVADYERTLSENEWLLAVQYDQNRWEGATHLTRSQLDQISPSRPILLRHSNGHASIANSAALTAAGVTRDTPDPSGGVYVRDDAGDLNGVLLEAAHEFVTSTAPKPDIDKITRAILDAGALMRELGITSATDMMTGRWNLAEELEAYRRASEQGCGVRLRLFLQWGAVFGSRALEPSQLSELTGAMRPDRCRAEGIKIFADGAIASATAAIYGGFLTEPGSATSDADRHLIYRPEKLKGMVQRADDSGWRVAIHTIGDRSTDLVMDAYEQTADPRRHRIEHAMLLSDDQIERIARLGSHVTMQPEFLLRFGPAYARQLGPERASQLKRARSLIEAGVPLSLSSDRPIVPGNPWDGIRAATHRPEAFDPRENLTEGEAFDAYTRMGAIANGDGGKVGEIEAGQWADFQILDTDPCAVVS